jgi:hypothetical protein
MSPQWPFEDAENTASFTTREILDLGLPVVYVSHDDEDGAWQFLGPDMAPTDTAHMRLVGLAEIVSRDPSLLELANLPLGWIATRARPEERWYRQPHSRAAKDAHHRRRVGSNAGANAAAFYREIARTGVVWTIRDSEGFPSPVRPDGVRAMPFWSSESRVRRVISTAPAYAEFEPVKIALQDFRDRWLPGLMKDGDLVGVNWSGPRATGYDATPEDVRANVEAELNR